MARRLAWGVLLLALPGCLSGPATSSCPARYHASLQIVPSTNQTFSLPLLASTDAIPTAEGPLAAHPSGTVPWSETDNVYAPVNHRTYPPGANVTGAFLGTRLVFTAPDSNGMFSLKGILRSGVNLSNGYGLAGTIQNLQLHIAGRPVPIRLQASPSNAFVSLGPTDWQAYGQSIPANLAVNVSSAPVYWSPDLPALSDVSQLELPVGASSLVTGDFAWSLQMCNPFSGPVYGMASGTAHFAFANTVSPPASATHVRPLSNGTITISQGHLATAFDVGSRNETPFVANSTFGVVVWYPTNGSGPGLALTQFPQDLASRTFGPHGTVLASSLNGTMSEPSGVILSPWPSLAPIAQVPGPGLYVAILHVQNVTNNSYQGHFSNDDDIIGAASLVT
ncbi:MAG: hypothetical protein ACYDDF_10965 [Thermoplasmatota archaeon]